MDRWAKLWVPTFYAFGLKSVLYQVQAKPQLPGLKTICEIGGKNSTQHKTIKITVFLSFHHFFSSLCLDYVFVSFGGGGSYTVFSVHNAFLCAKFKQQGCEPICARHNWGALRDTNRRRGRFSIFRLPFSVAFQWECTKKKKTKRNAEWHHN